MKRLAILALLAAAAVSASACGSTTPTTPSGNSNTVKFTAALSPANEVPAITNAESVGRGAATITFNLTKNTSGGITAATADFSFDATGFPAGTPINLAHIHTGASGVSGGIVVNTGLAAGEIVLANGSQTGILKSNINVDPALATDIVANPGSYYFNIHSALNGGGVARGQLVKQ